jgi:predicted DNA-binding transcriptional regulator YafY
MGVAMRRRVTEGALAKIERVLPDGLRAQVRALAAALIIDRPSGWATETPLTPTPAALFALATAAAEERRITMTYHGWDGAITRRAFDPYAVVYLANAAWYGVGFCHLRSDVRVFRLDRMRDVQPEGASFIRPSDFDPLAYVRRSLALLPGRWHVEVVLDAPLVEARASVSTLFALVSEEDGDVVLRCTATDIDWLARTLVSMPFTFRVRTPPELLAALERVQARIARARGCNPVPHAIDPVVIAINCRSASADNVGRYCPSPPCTGRRWRRCTSAPVVRRLE